MDILSQAYKLISNLAEKENKKDSLRKQLAETQAQINKIKEDLKNTLYSDYEGFYRKVDIYSYELNRLLRLEHHLKSELARYEH